MKKNIIKLFFAAIFTLGISAAALAKPITWNISGGTFDDGRVLTGSFDFDVDTVTYSNVSISTYNPESYGPQFGLISGPVEFIDGPVQSGPSGPFGGHSYTTDDVSLSTFFGSTATSLTLKKDLGPLSGTVSEFDILLSLVFEEPLTNSGGIVSISTGMASFEGDIIDMVSWLYIDDADYVSGGFLVAQAPEPTTLALMGLGLAGIGFARKKKLS